MPSGLVLTGGGSLLTGMNELAMKKFGMPVRIGMPEAFLSTENNTIPDVLKSPIYSTAYGLLIYATGERGEEEISSHNNTAFSKVVKKMKSWIYDFF